jgi:hypothetical protein
MYTSPATKEVYFDNSGEDLSSKVRLYMKEELEEAKTDGNIVNYFKVSQANLPLNEVEDIRADGFFASEDLLKELSFDVTEGEWFDTYCANGQKGDLVPIVIGHNLKSKYEIGEVINLDSYDIKCIVIGILKDNTRFINPNTSGNNMDLNQATQIADNMVIVAKEDEDADTFLIRLPEEDHDVSEQIVLEKIADVAGTFSYRYMADKAYQDNIWLTEMQTTLAILALLVCTVGIGCGNLISFVKGKRRQAVYLLCGMSQKTSIYISVVENVIKLYIPAIFGLCFFYRYCRKQDYSNVYVDGWNVVITVVIITIIFASTLFRTRIIARDDSALKIIHS